MKIQSNISSLQALRSLGKTNKALARAMERLSSGKRINQPADDPAGLAVSTSLESQVRGFSRGLQNVNQAKSMLEVADGAISTQIDLVQRMRELAMQSANGVINSQEREHLNQELQQLFQEYNRITNETAFNGIRLLDGSPGTISIQYGPTSADTAAFSIGNLQSSHIFTKVVGSGGFQARKTLSTTPLSNEIQTGDLNNDGHLDLVLNNRNSGYINVHLGNGDGTFQTRTTLTPVNGSTDLKLADLNQDKILDIIVGEDNSNRVAIFFGTGNATFSSAVTYATGAVPRNIATGDLNNDGRIDFAVSDGDDATLSIFLNMGNGQFASRKTLSVGVGGVGTNTATDVDFGDLNGDGFVDVVGMNRASNYASVFINDGAGNFTLSNTFSTGINTSNLDLADFNSDGILDEVNSSYGDNAVKLRLGTGNGTFGVQTSFVGGTTPVDVVAADLNLDGHLDVISSNFTVNTLSILWGNGKGTGFSSPTTLAVGGRAYGGASVADFNEDQVPDIIEGDYDVATASIYLQNPSVVSAVGEIDISTQAKAQNLLGILDRGLKAILGQRGQLGAFESRFDFMASGIMTNIENLSEARSRILDADIAEDSTDLVRLQILQQAGVAVLLHANLQHKMVLELLRS